MDAARFDALLAALTTAPSRRAALRLLGGLGLACLVGQTEAKKKHKHKNKKKCAKAGQSYSKKKKCCKGLGKDVSGLCLPAPSLPTTPPPPPCVPQTCPAHPCGSLPDGCGGALACGCPATQVCYAGTCHPCVVVDGICQPCIVVEGICQPCTVTCSSGDSRACGDALQTAMDGGGTVYVCPGRYEQSYLLTGAVHVIGAGEGTDEASDTILDAAGSNRVLQINATAGLVELERLRITGGNVASLGAGIILDATTLRMTDCTVSGNTSVNATGGAGILAVPSSTLDLLRCTIRDNHATGIGSGGGIYTHGTTTLTHCLVEANSAGNDGGGLYVVEGSTTLSGNTQVRGNTANRGGGILNVIGTLQIAETCRVTQNAAAALGDGGGILNDVLGTVTLDGDEPSPIVVNNCFENCVGPVDKCSTVPPVSCPP